MVSMVFFNILVSSYFLKFLFFFLHSPALSRAKFFLPQLQKANEDLEAIINSGKNDDVDIEKISQDGQFIEMVSCGLLQFIFNDLFIS